MNRKKRSDRKHIVYCISNIITGDFYIGVTQGFRQRDLKIRVQKHFRRALTEDKSWSLCKAIREFSPSAFDYRIVDIVRGKTPAHVLERALIGEHSPTLNSQ